MTAHFSKNGHDKAVKRRLQILSSRRRAMLKYCIRRDYLSYRSSIYDLGLRPIPIIASKHLPKVRKESHKTVNERNARMKRRKSRGHLGH